MGMEGKSAVSHKGRDRGTVGEPIAEGQCGLKEGTPSWAVAWGRSMSGDTGARTAAQVPGPRAPRGSRR